MEKGEKKKNYFLGAKKSADLVSAHPLRANLSFGQRAADTITRLAGSWIFIIIFLIFLMAWVLANVSMWVNRWDPYPFILLNLFLSMLAAIQAPVILMSQNRANQQDRLRATYDYAVNRKAAREIEHLRKQLERIERALSKKR